MFQNRRGQSGLGAMMVVGAGAALIYFAGIGIEKGAKAVAHGVEKGSKAVVHFVEKPFHHKKPAAK